VTKALDGTDVLVIPPTGTGKMAILMILMLVLNHMKENSSEASEYVQHGVRFPVDPIAAIVYPTNCSEEEQVCM
jgi:hypothetical protein